MVDDLIGVVVVEDGVVEGDYWDVWFGFVDGCCGGLWYVGWMGFYDGEVVFGFGYGVLGDVDDVIYYLYWLVSYCYELDE